VGELAIGWVELRIGEGHWWPVLRLDPFIQRGDDALGWLFGSRYHPRVAPIAPQRGRPPDLSEDVRRDLAASEAEDRFGWDHSWVSWAEFLALDWEAGIPGLGPTAHIYDPASSGPYPTEELIGESFAQVVGIPWNDALDQFRLAEREPSWERGGRLVRLEWRTARDAFGDAGWPQVRSVMEYLARYRDPHEVRLVYWCEP
jgi:hypothetical protein